VFDTERSAWRQIACTPPKNAGEIYLHAVLIGSRIWVYQSFGPVLYFDVGEAAIIF